jgi:hypothetical protein
MAAAAITTKNETEGGHLSQHLHGGRSSALGQPVEDRVYASKLLTRQFESRSDRLNTTPPIIGVEHAIARLADCPLEMVQLDIDEVQGI